MTTLGQAAHRAYALLLIGADSMRTGPAVTGRRSGADDGPRRPGDDRGDVPGWVMITMMTAIVVIVLLGVFQESVVNAVRNAFDSINGQGGSGAPAGAGAR